MTITPSNICGTGTPRTVNVIVRDVPTQAGNFIGLDTVCIGQQNYQVPVQQGVNYTWSISGGGTVIPSGNAATIDWQTAGTHTITYTFTNNELLRFVEVIEFYIKIIVDNIARSGNKNGG